MQEENRNNINYSENLLKLDFNKKNYMSSHSIPLSQNLFEYSLILGIAFILIWIVTTRFFRSSLLTFYAFNLFLISFLTVQISIFMETKFLNEVPRNRTYIFASLVSLIIFVLVLIFRSRISNPLRQVINQTNKMADGDLADDFLFGVKGSGETKSLLHSNRVLSSRFKTIVLNIKGSSIELAQSAEELASGSEEVAATTEEVTGTIQTIAEGAAEQVRRLEEVSQILNDMTNVIEESIRQIGVTSKITLDLAEQTNLVSLNAAIEAAKAGGEGEGFHVVAEHVRQLSVESKSASNQVTKITNEISRRMRDSVNLIVGSVDQIATVAENTAASSQEAAAAAEEQAASLQEITKQAQKLAVLSEGSERIITELKV